MVFKKGHNTWNKNIPCSEETKKKISNANKGRMCAEEHKQKVSIAKKGCIVSKTTRKKISNTLKRKYASKELIISEVQRKESSDRIKGNNNPMKNPLIKEKHKIACNLLERREKISKANKGRKINFTDTWRKNLRIATAKRILRDCQTRSIGKNEKQILDELELSLGYKIKRQYQVIGYFLDGYISKLNLAIEIDENNHFDINKILSFKDKKRQLEIEKELNCNFIRIKDNFI